MTAQKQTIANQKNAQKSTGPKTTYGHGFVSQKMSHKTAIIFCSLAAVSATIRFYAWEIYYQNNAFARPADCGGTTIKKKYDSTPYANNLKKG